MGTAPLRASSVIGGEHGYGPEGGKEGRQAGRKEGRKVGR